MATIHHLPVPDIIALIDSNNFYVSCEQVFRLSLSGRPVVVLSNDDGYEIACSNETKAPGIRMGAPRLQIRHLEDKAWLAALSIDFELCVGMSNQMMSLAPGLGYLQEF